MSATHRAAAWAAVIATCLPMGCQRPMDSVPSVAKTRALEPLALATPSPRPVASAASDELPRLAEQMAWMQAEMAEMRRQIARLSAAPQVAETAPDPRRDPNVRAEMERAEQARVAASETAFQSEPNDAAWSQMTSARLRAALSDVEPALRDQVRGIECRSHSCRLELSADASTPPARELSGMLVRLTQTLPNATVGRLDPGYGVAATVLYLSR